MYDVRLPNEFDYECVMFWLAIATKVAQGYQQLRNESIKRYLNRAISTGCLLMCLSQRNAISHMALLLLANVFWILTAQGREIATDDPRQAFLPFALLFHCSLFRPSVSLSICVWECVFDSISRSLPCISPFYEIPWLAHLPLIDDEILKWL